MWSGPDQLMHGCLELRGLKQRDTSTKVGVVSREARGFCILTDLQHGRLSLRSQRLQRYALFFVRTSVWEWGQYLSSFSKSSMHRILSQADNLGIAHLPLFQESVCVVCWNVSWNPFVQFYLNLFCTETKCSLWFWNLWSQVWRCQNLKCMIV